MANNPSRIRIVSGYLLLIALLMVAIGYINREMQQMTHTDNHEAILSLRRRTANEIMNQLHQAEIIGQAVSMGQITRYEGYKEAMQKASEAVGSLRAQLEDSLQQARLDTVAQLLIEKEKNMRNLLRNVRESGSDKVYQQYVEALIAQQDSVLRRPFYPPKKNAYFNPKDTIATLLKDVQNRVAGTRQQHLKRLNANLQSLQINGLQLNQKVSQLLNTIEDEDQARAQLQHLQRERIRQSSARTIAGIAIAAVLMSAVFLVLIWRDITRSNHYRKELEKAKQRAENLLVAREKLMLAITHDIKAPVGSIIGYSDLLSRLLDNERALFYVKNMQSSANHLLSLVNSLLDFHRLEAQKMEVNSVAFQPRQLLDTIVASFKPIAERKKLVLHYECDASLDGTFVSDPFRIRQITENLMSNALKFTSQGSVTLLASYDGTHLQLSVCDTGCGIPEGERQRIFQEFTRLRNAQGQEGFGLGLAITRKLIHLMNGDIRIESQPGKGSCFYVTLPLQTTSADILPNEGKCTPTHLPPLRILLIDDDRIQLQLTSAMLDAPGVKVTCLEHPDELFAHLKESTYDVLLTDIQMPAMNGFELLKVLRDFPVSQAKELPVIALTARSDMDEAFFRSQGFAACLFKPFSQSELIDLLNKVCPQKTLDFSSLTAFSADDPKAAAEIMRTFVSETQKNLNRLKQTINDKNLKEAAGIAHKFLPLCRMLNATSCLPPLLWLEGKREGGPMTEEATKHILHVVKDMESILQEARTTY